MGFLGLSVLLGIEPVVSPCLSPQGSCLAVGPISVPEEGRQPGGQGGFQNGFDPSTAKPRLGGVWLYSQLVRHTVTGGKRFYFRSGGGGYGGAIHLYLVSYGKRSLLTTESPIYFLESSMLLQ